MKMLADRIHYCIGPKKSLTCFELPASVVCGYIQSQPPRDRSPKR